MHAICGNAFPGSCEGHGQKRICHDCGEKSTSECYARGVPAGKGIIHSSAAEAHRNETNKMLGLLECTLQLVNQHKNVPPLQQPPPPPMLNTTLNLSNTFASKHGGCATGTTEASGSEDEDSTPSDNDGSEDSEERRRKKRITPDAKFQFLGDEYGYLRLPPKKRVVKNKMRNKVQKKWEMSMKRHWKTKKQEKCIGAITIRRCNISTVCYYF